MYFKFETSITLKDGQQGNDSDHMATLPRSKLIEILFAATRGHAATWLRGHYFKTLK